jgi:hypothetical protein
VFDPKTGEQGYLASKNRAYQGTRDAQFKSYGTRGEHWISLELFNAMQAELIKQSQRGEPANCNYYYAVPSETLFGFLRS